MQSNFDALNKIVQRGATGDKRSMYEIRNLIKSGITKENIFIETNQNLSEHVLSKLWSSFRLFNDECRERYPIEGREVAKFIMKDFVDKNKDLYLVFEELFLKFIRMPEDIKFLMIVPPSLSPQSDECTKEISFVVIGITHYFTTVCMNAIYNSSNKIIAVYKNVNYTF